MKLSELTFDYPEKLIATQPVRPSRVLWVQGHEFSEISLKELIQRIPAGDVFVINNTKVLKRRIFTEQGLEILFLGAKSSREWEVLFPSKKYVLGSVISLPLGLKMKLLQKGRPQRVELSQEVGEGYFEKVAELPLPPYIQKMRSDRHTVAADESWYQTAWAKYAGSFAAPTASLHFSEEDIQTLKNRGVNVVELTLHVGLGTFLPVTADDLDDHDMHEEYTEIPEHTWEQIQSVKSKGGHVWGLGTTVTRALESVTAGGLTPDGRGGYSGMTKLLIQPGFQYQVIDRLMTNFHQPESTLLALVAGFRDLETVKKAYAFAIEKEFRLFSYGDLSVWIKP
ncbi:MAG: tRNA preQ1(34) S-adenosylmethionine ribosyltransferase-isomerase QueA [Proteobacteria bacterium]|nr:tRNA preQ1(34) S-adenosylmethionine ribosyltransferase-isomerase QueA [Pseudomonadota bacterium]